MGGGGKERSPVLFSGCGCVGEQGKVDVLFGVSPTPSFLPGKTAGRSLVPQSCLGSLRLRPHPPRASRSRIPWRPEHYSRSPAHDARVQPLPREVWMHGWETSITTTPPTKMPKYENNRTSITGGARLPKVRCLSVALLAILPGQLRQREQLCRSRSSPRCSFLRPLGRLPPPLPPLPCRLPFRPLWATHTPGDTLRTWPLTLRLNPADRAWLPKPRGCALRGPVEEAKRGRGGVVEPLSSQPRPVPIILP